MPNFNIKDGHRPRPNPAIALALAWLAPGTGHIYLGRRKRGVIIFVSLAMMFWAGIAMGGVMTIDRRSEPYWFMADMLTGVHGLGAWQMQRSQVRRLSAAVADSPDFQRQTRELDREIYDVERAGRHIAQQIRSQPRAQNLQKQFEQIQAQWQQLKRRRELLLDSMLRRELAAQNLTLTAPVDTVARAYAGVAGLLNLLCMFDVVLLALMGRYGEPPAAELQAVPAMSGPGGEEGIAA